MKYSQEGGHVWVRIGRAGMYVTVAVKDDGIGMSPEDCARVFDEFYRVRGEHTASIPGTGLGLSLVKRLTELHEGTVASPPSWGRAASSPSAFPRSPPEIHPERPASPCRATSPQPPIFEIRGSRNYIESMSATHILVMGATGNISSLVIPQLLAGGAAVRALVHNPDKASGLSAKGVQVIVGDLEDPVSLAKAFAGVSAVFLLTPFGEKADALARNAIAAAKKAGSPYIVRLSAVKAALDAPTANGRSHGQTEKDLKESGLVVILKPHYFMQNLLGQTQSIMTQRAFYHGMGQAKLGMIDVRDIADCAAKALLDRSLAGKTFTPTGPRASATRRLRRHSQPRSAGP